jgi:hypothetical protein
MSDSKAAFLSSRFSSKNLGVSFNGIDVIMAKNDGTRATPEIIVC